jgi:AcrR family transcriptional regulator
VAKAPTTARSSRARSEEGARPRRRNREQTITDILDAAEALLERKGPDGFGLAELGSEAGVSFGLSHHYFGGKEALMHAVLRRRLRDIGRRTRKLQEEGGFWDRDAPAVQLMFDTYAAHPGFARLLGWGLLTGLLTADEVLEESKPDRDAVLSMTKSFRKGIPGASMKRAGATGALLSSAVLGYALLKPLLETGYDWDEASEKELRRQLVVAMKAVSGD